MRRVLTVLILLAAGTTAAAPAETRSPVRAPSPYAPGVATDSSSRIGYNSIGHLTQRRAIEDCEATLEALCRVTRASAGPASGCGAASPGTG